MSQRLLSLTDADHLELDGFAVEAFGSTGTFTFSGPTGPREIGPDHKSVVPRAEVRESLSQLRVDGVASAV